jgi:hypothetical protein
METQPMHIYEIFGLDCYCFLMAKRDEIVERPRGDSWRTSAHAPDAMRRQLYQQMLRDELGRDPEFQLAGVEDPSRISGVLVFLMLSVLAFVLVLGIWVWRSGMLEGFTLQSTEQVPDKGWMLGDKRAIGRENQTVETPLESFVEDQTPAEAPVAAE